jgi:serine/threonine protein kinase
VLMRCLAKDPADRPQSATALAEQLVASALTPQWTPQNRATWWTAHRKSLAGVQKPKPLGTSHLDRTVKIAFADRTP